MVSETTVDREGDGSRREGLESLDVGGGFRASWTPRLE